MSKELPHPSLDLMKPLGQATCHELAEALARRAVLQDVKCIAVGVVGHEARPDDSFTQVAFAMYDSGVKRAKKMIAGLSEHMDEKINECRAEALRVY